MRGVSPKVGLPGIPAFSSPLRSSGEGEAFLSAGCSGSRAASSSGPSRIRSCPWIEWLLRGAIRPSLGVKRNSSTSPDFQTRLGYPVARAGKANLTMSTNQLAQRFGCTAMTLEMPFKDNNDLPCANQGWSTERSRILGRDCLGALLEWLEPG